MKKLLGINAVIYAIVSAVFIFTIAGKNVIGGSILVAVFQMVVLLSLWLLSRISGNRERAQQFGLLVALFIYIALVILDIGSFLPLTPQSANADYLGLTVIVPWTLLAVIVVYSFFLFRGLSKEVYK